MAQIRETGAITAIRENGKTTGYTTAEIDALAESGELDTVRITEVEDRNAKVTLADLTPEARAEIMAEARAEKPPEPYDIKDPLSVARWLGRQEGDRRQRERAREAAKPPEVKAREAADGRTSYITEATENILKMVGVELTEADRAKIAESAGSAVRATSGNPGAVGTREARERFVAEATANVSRMAGVEDADAKGAPASSRLDEAATTREKKGDFIKDATADILGMAGTGK